MTRIRGTFLATVLTAMSVALVAFSAQAIAFAASPGSNGLPEFVLEPSNQEGSYFTATLEAGSARTLTVILGSTSDELVRARTFVADAYTVTNGGFGVKQEGEPTTGTTTWLDYPAETLDLAPGSLIERTFTVTIPDGTKPGQYITGMVLQTAQPIAVGGTAMLKQIISKAIAVFITVPGKITPRLELGAATVKQSPTMSSLLIEVSNSGNVLLRPTGMVTVYTDDGQPVLHAPIVMGSVYAGTATSIELPIATALTPGDYVVAIELMDADTGARAEAADLPLTVTDPMAAALLAQPVTIESMTVEPSLDQASETFQFVNITVTLANTGPPVAVARLTMHVMLDGALVEDFAVNSSLVVPTGATEIQQRYVPLTSWAPGTYRFSVTLEAIDTKSGEATVLANSEAPTEVVVP